MNKTKGTVLISLSGFNQEGLFSKETRYSVILDCWVYLREKLATMGYQVKSADTNSLDNCQAVLFIDWKTVSPNSFQSLSELVWKVRRAIEEPPRRKRKRELYQECLKKNLQKNMALFLWEGKANSPENYKFNLQKKFDHIFTWDDDLVDNQRYFKFYLPYYRSKEKITPVSFKTKKLIVSITRNKTSSFPGELYSERKKSIEYFNNYFPDDFNFYGPDWDKNMKFTCYRGLATNKLNTLSHYKFTLCYENFQRAKGYITEKIFDCFKAKTVPIYWGAPNINQYVDQEAFIDRRKFKTHKELAAYLTGMNEKRYNDYLNQADKYLRTEKFNLFMPQNFAQNIITVMGL